MQTKIKQCFILVILMVAMTTVQAANKKTTKKKSADNQVKAMSGISIVGNKEAPKSLYIVPWKNSAVGMETSLHSGFLNEDMTPVDKEVFMRELEFYDISNTKQ